MTTGVYKATPPTLTDGLERPVLLDASGNLKAVVVPPTPWQYAAATSGIASTTTAVTIKAAAGSGIRNYITSLSIAHDTLGAVTEFAIRDGAGGTVIFRTKLQTTAKEDTIITFPSPLFSTANTLLEVVTLTSVTGGVFVNASGFTAA